MIAITSIEIMCILRTFIKYEQHIFNLENNFNSALYSNGNDSNEPVNRNNFNVEDLADQSVEINESSQNGELETFLNRNKTQF